MNILLCFSMFAFGHLVWHSAAFTASGHRFQTVSPLWETTTQFSSAASDDEGVAPPPPPFVPKPLPLILGGGLFLFATSVRTKDKDFAASLLQQAQVALRSDPVITMELGQDVESGGVYSSLSTTTTVANKSSQGQRKPYKQLVLQFQIEGGNAWAQGVAYGVQAIPDGNFELVSLEVANMDATMNGKPFEINLSRFAASNQMTKPS